MAKPLSVALVEQARVLRVNECLNWTQVAQRLGLRSTEGIRRRLDPAYREKQNAKHAAYQVGYEAKKRGEYVKRPELARLAPGSYSRGAGNVARARSAVPPPHVIEEAEKVASAPRTLLMLQFGDPPPGRSALDRMRQDV
jgi:hypothetical protein